MKSFKAILTTALTLALFCTLSAQNVAEKTLVKSFNLKGSQVVMLDLDGDIDVQEWDNDIMRVQITIAIPNGNNAMLKSLIRAGRYNLQSKNNEEDAFMVYAPGLDREIKLNGNPLKEKLTYQIFAPSSVVIKQAGEASTNKDLAKEDTSSL